MKQFLKKISILILLIVTLTGNIGVSINTSYAAEEHPGVSTEEETSLKNDSKLRSCSRWNSRIFNICT